MRGSVENPLWTARYTPSQSSSGGAGWRRDESTHMHARLVNTIGCCECNRALLGFLFSYSYLLSVNLLQCSSLASPDLVFAKSITALYRHDGAVGKFLSLPSLGLLFSSAGLSRYHCID